MDRKPTASETEPLLPTASSSQNTALDPSSSRTSDNAQKKGINYEKLIASLVIGLLVVGAGVYGGVVWRREASKPVDPFGWKKCDEDPRFLCGHLKVPNDYSNHSRGYSTLAITNYPATCKKSERQGIIFTNYGGPGAAGYSVSFERAPILQSLFGNQHDIISFDQRGQGRTLPKLECFGSALDYEVFKANTVFESTFSIPPNWRESTDVLVAQQIEAMALMKAQGQKCLEAMGEEAIGLMGGTTTLVYDMEEISRQMEGEDAPLNFHGGSYGTIAGAYLADMLPHKAGRIVIDGVVQSNMWANEFYENQVTLRDLLTDAEKTYQWFLQDCFNAGSVACPLTLPEYNSSNDIEVKIDEFLAQLYYAPVSVTNTSRPGLLKDGDVRMKLFTALQMPVVWKRFAAALASAMYDSKPEEFFTLFGSHRGLETSPPKPAKDGFIETGQNELHRLAVSCMDGRVRTPSDAVITAEDVVDDLMITMDTVTERFGATVHLMEQHGGCEWWPGSGHAPFKFNGPFNATLAHPMLIIANTHDPITPYAAALQVHKDHAQSSHLLLSGTVGHSYLAPMPKCGQKIVTHYFLTGELPEGDETFCPREVENMFKMDRSLHAVHNEERLISQGLF